MNDARGTGQPASTADPPALDLSALSPAEREVAALALTGLSSHAIAAELVVSESTVHTHLTHIYQKLGVRNRLELLAAASRQGPARSNSGLPEAGRRSSRNRLVLAAIGALLAVAALTVAALLAASPAARP